LVSYHERIGLGFADDLTGQYANKMGLKKYVIVPSILQYANKKSSKGDDMFHELRRVAETIRSYACEEYDPVELHGAF
jgi:hypothetical protein